MEVVNISSHSENDEIRLKMLINNIREYLYTGTEDVGLRVNRNLQVLSSSVDLSIFDPDTITSIQFYPAFYNLMTKLDRFSQTLWSCVDVLNNVCKNKNARKILIDNHRFISPLSRMLGDQLTSERKITLLKLIQDLTCGIRIDGNIPYLEHLMMTLAKWVQSQNEEISTLSLGILVNVCYRNIAATYIFSRCVNVKELLKYSSPLKGSMKDYHICKLLIVLDDYPPVFDELIFSLIDKTFEAVKEAYLTKDVIQLRQVVEFFSDFTMNKNSQKVMSYEGFQEKIQPLLLVIENNPKRRKVEGSDIADAEFVSLILQFLATITKLKVKPINYSEIIYFALKWIQIDGASEQALTILNVIVKTIPKEEKIMGLLLGSLPKILKMLANKENKQVNSMDHVNRISCLLQLLHSLLSVEQIRSELLQNLTHDMLADIFVPLLTDVPTNFDIFNTDKLCLYVFTLALAVELTKYSQTWVPFVEDLFRSKIIQNVIVYAIHKNTGVDVKKAVFDIATNFRFPKDEIATNMCNLESMFVTNCSRTSRSYEVSKEFSRPRFERIDSVIDSVRKKMSEGNSLQISTSDIIELYEFKLAGLEEIQRINEKCIETTLEKDNVISQLTKAQNRLHQVLLYTQQRHEETLKQKETKNKLLKDMHVQLESQMKKTKNIENQVSLNEQKLTDCQTELEVTKQRLNDVTKSLNESNKRSDELQNLLEKVDANYKRQEKLLEKKIESIKDLTARNNALEEQIRKLQHDLTTNAEILETTKIELEKKTNILLSISQMTLSK